VLYTGPVSGKHSFDYFQDIYAAKGIELVQLNQEEELKITSSPLATQSYRVYEFLATQQLDIIHFPEWEGIGYYSLLAKYEGVSFVNTKMVVGLHGSTRWTLSAKGKIPTSITELEADYMEQRSVELADMVWAPSNYYARYTAEQGWKIPTEKFLMPYLLGSELEEMVQNIKPRGNFENLISESNWN
jgi:hypothetical protein